MRCLPPLAGMPSPSRQSRIRLLLRRNVQSSHLKVKKFKNKIHSCKINFIVHLRRVLRFSLRDNSFESR